MQLKICAITIFAFSLLCCEAWAQTSSQLTGETTSGFPETHLPGPGTYALPSVPLIATPIVDLPQPTLQAGAGNSTGTNVAGTQNATLSVLSQRVNPPLIAPRLVGAQVSDDLYPRAENGRSH